MQTYRPLNLRKHSLLQKLFLLKNKNRVSLLYLTENVNKSAIFRVIYFKEQNNSIFVSYNN
jgi:hypothetical protein